MLSTEKLSLTRNQYRLLVGTLMGITSPYNRAMHAHDWAKLLEANPQAHPWSKRKEYDYMLHLPRKI